MFWNVSIADENFFYVKKGFVLIIINTIFHTTKIMFFQLQIDPVLYSDK
jgi:hypothetical protein